MVDAVATNSQAENPPPPPAAATGNDEFQKSVDQQRQAPKPSGDQSAQASSKAPDDTSAPAVTGNAQSSAPSGPAASEQAATGDGAISNLSGIPSGPGNAPIAQKSVLASGPSSLSGTGSTDASSTSGDGETLDLNGDFGGSGDIQIVAGQTTTDPNFILTEVGNLYPKDDPHKPVMGDLSVTEEDDPYPELKDLVYISTPDALGAGLMYSITRPREGTDQVSLVYNQNVPGVEATPTHYDHLVGLRTSNPDLFSNGLVLPVEEDVPTGSGDAEETDALYGPPRPDWTRPKGDTRTAEEIIKENGLLANLGKREQDWLINGFSGDWGDAGKPEKAFEGIGNYKTNADTAFLASVILNNIEQYDENGHRIYNDNIGNNRLDGFTKAVNGDAKAGTEAGRFQDFTKYGYERLKGGEEAPPVKNDHSDVPNISTEVFKALKDQGYREVTGKDRFAPAEIEKDSISNKLDVNGEELRLPQGMLVFGSDGQDYYVSKDANAGVYYTVNNFIGSAIEESAKQGFRGKFGRDLSSLNIYDAETTIKDDDGKYMTVSDYISTQQVDNYRRMLENDEINMQDPRAQYYMALSAKYGSIDLIPYAELVGEPFADSNRDIKDPITLTDEDRAALIKLDEIDQKLEELSRNDLILFDAEELLKEAINKVDNRDAIRDGILETFNSKEFIDYTSQLGGGGPDEAQYVQGQLLSSLRYLVPEEEYTSVVANLERNKLMASVDGFLEDPTKIDEKAVQLAGRDVLQWMINAGRISTVAGMHASWTFETLYKEYIQGQKSPADITKTLINLDSSLQAGKLPEAQFENRVREAMEKAYVPVADRASLVGVFGELNKFGALGTMAAAATLLSGIYQTTGANNPSASWNENLMIAKEFLLFTSFSGSMGRFAGNVLERMGRPGLVEAFGLGKSLPEIWGENGAYSKYVKSADANMTEFVSKLSASTDLVEKDGLSASMRETIKNLGGDKSPLMTSIEKLISDDLKRMNLSPNAIKPSTLKLGIGSTINVLANVADAAWGGIEIAQGANLLSKAKTPLDKTEAAFRFIYGGMAGSAGIIGSAEAMGLFTLSMFSKVANFVTRLPSIFFLAGIGFSAAGYILGLAKRQQTINRVTNEQSEWFRDLDRMGLMTEDWNDRLEYARYSFYKYNGRHAPEDKDYWSFQQEEYDNFVAAELPKWLEDDDKIVTESSFWRLEERLHVYPDKDKGWGKRDFRDQVVTDQMSGRWGYYDEDGNYVDESHLEGFAGPG